MTDGSTSETTPPGLLNFGSEVILFPVACALWGATCVQLFLYIVHNSSGDRKFLKWTAMWTWSMNTAHMIAAFHGFYMLTAKHWGDIEYVKSLSLGYVWSLFFTTFVSSPVQLFFAYRLWMFSHKPIFILIVTPLVLAQPALLTAFTITCYQRDISTNATLYSMKSLPAAAWSIAAGCDIFISASLLFFIWKYKNPPDGFKSSTKILDRVTVLTINTGMWTAIASLLTMILLVSLPDNPAFTAASFLLAPLYCNTLLANLNSRKFIMNGGEESSDVIFNHFQAEDPYEQGISSNSTISLSIVQAKMPVSTISRRHGQS